MFEVMLVDDQEPFRRLARSMLERDQEFRVVAEASSGVEALRLMERVSPDLVLMDVQMQPVNGFEAARLILGRYSKVKIVLTSMNADNEYVRLAREIGALAFIPKKDLRTSTLRQALQG